MILIALYQENYIICKFFNKKCVFSVVFIKYYTYVCKTLIYNFKERV